MKQVIECTLLPVLFGRFNRLLTPFIGRPYKQRRGRADMLSRHMLKDIGLSDDARGDPLYGSTRRRL